MTAHNVTRSALRRLRRAASGLAAFGLLLLSLVAARAADPVDPDRPEILEKKPLTLAADENAPLNEEPLTAADRDHWSFRPLRRPDAPPVADPTWPAGDIDRFVLARLEAEQLAPQPAADRLTLLRRVTFDLTGLPPTPEQASAFLADPAPDAYDRLVARLLDSPAYGERWAQHWLDLARFAETDGFEHDKVRPEAWRYRDWVIQALNADMPLDRFIHWQLAGDELEPDNRDAAIATGFLLAGPDMPDINLREERRHMLLGEITSTVGAVFLGLQVGCAQCHNHKFDPISQADFYRLRAIFETAELTAHSKQGRVVFETGKPAVSHVMLRGDFRRPGAVVEPAFPRIANAAGETVTPGELVSTAAAARADRAGTASGSTGTQPSGRRSALAHWLTRSDHPLTTRVLMNWVWQQHFGQGLSRSPGDFGVMGESPSHPELLDWLATELIRQQWSLKKMHALLVTSAAYRQASRPASPAWTAAQTREAERHFRDSRERDPQNRLLARAGRRRLDGEAIRDAMLASADRLSPAKGGPGIMPPLPQELLCTLLKGQWKTSPQEEDHRRRSIYLLVRRNLRYPLFDAFDRPDAIASCPRRNLSTTAPQALMLLNSDFSLAAARDLAGYVYQHADATDAARIELLYRRTLGRGPTAAELSAAERFLKSEAALVAARMAGEPVPDETQPKLALPANFPADADQGAGAALVDLCLAMFNLNEFIYLD